MKNLLHVYMLAFCCLLSATLCAQIENAAATDMKFADRLSITATMATQGLAVQDLNQLTWQNFRRASLGEISLSYRLNDRMTLGLGNIAGLGNCFGGYFDEEGQLFPFDDDDEDDDDEEEEEDDDEEEGCDDDLFESLMGMLDWQLLDNLPFFLQAAGGYTFHGNAPAYSMQLGYRPAIAPGVKLQLGLRYSNVLRSLPPNAASLAPTNGIRLELGLRWSPGELLSSK